MPRKLNANLAYKKEYWGTVSVYRRHLPTCQSPRNEYECKCPCWIALRLKDEKPKRYAAHTSDKEAARQKALRTLRNCDPEVRADLERLKAMEEAQKRKTMPLTEAIDAYSETQENTHTRRKIKQVLGGIDKDGKPFGNFMRWNFRRETPLRTLDQVSDTVLIKWLGECGWNDSTKYDRWGAVCRFFNWAMHDGMLTSNPAAKVPRPNVKPGNRCGFFPDNLYEAMLTAAKSFTLKGISSRADMATRLTAFLELGRWTGMAICDMRKFDPDWIDENDVLTYRRHKTRDQTCKICHIPLLPRVAALLRSVPPEPLAVDPHRPFGLSDATWRDRLRKVAKAAGITKIKTEHGKEVGVHPHQLRDTFCMFQVRCGVPDADIIEMTGHTDPKTFRKHYLSNDPIRAAASVNRIRNVYRGNGILNSDNHAS